MSDVKTHWSSSVVLLSVLVVLQGCGGSSAEEDASAVYEPAYSRVTQLGGDTTNNVSNQSGAGFDTPAANLTDTALALHLEGDAAFEASFIRALDPDHPNVDGLGPVHNNTACSQCHARDGRGNFSAAALTAATDEWTVLGSNEAIFLRISIEPEQPCLPTVANLYCAPVAVPGFAAQLFHRSVLGLRDDSGAAFTGLADVAVRFEASQVQYADGTVEPLLKPVFAISNPYDQPGEAVGDNLPAVSRLLQDDVKTSPRMGMPMFGLGLLEAIAEADILALADEDDVDGDGISGRPNWVYDPIKAAAGDPEPKSLGRFGWKASTPSVLVQSAGAYRGDMGITNYVFPEESIAGTALYDQHLAQHPEDDGQNGAEVDEATLKAAVFYASTLAVPARRDVDDAIVLQGAALFEQANCTGCHTPAFKTAGHAGIAGPSGVVSVDAVQQQTIYPFSDMLLHDMGEGLADGRTDFAATGREWKTRPLWGIGLTQVVNPLARYLHDGRARNLREAILWHGGEAEASKEAFRTMDATERQALIRFLQSL